jgi:asparagine synthase (glutamine-hydrolysing)
MCGITGLFRTGSSVEAAELTAMNDSLRHRGPDGYGIKMFDNGGIGHRRLSIIDLSTGAQPIANENGSVWITFNGEIYNFEELKKQLIAAGHHFKTNSDTEVIVHGYEQWGYDIVKKLRGMFAFAIVDLTKKIVFAARDNFGIKPFYYYSADKTFSFASELQAFNRLSGFRKEIDMQAVDQYLWMQYIPAPKTVWKNVFKLKPAHYVVYHFNGKLEEPVQYWEIDFRHKKRKTKAEWLEECEEVIRNSVKAHLVADVPFGAFLSGGIDSTLVVSYMAGILKKPVKTFSIGFEEEAFNELHYAGIAAEKFGTEHHIEIVKPDALAILPQLVKHYGEPFGDSSAIPTYYVCQLARKHVTMVLSGDGGDEGFAGYGSYLSWMKYQAINFRSGWKKKLLPFAQEILPSRYPKTDTLENWIKKIQYIGNDTRARLWQQDMLKNFSPEMDEFDAFFENTHRLSVANKVQYMDMKTYMPYDILTKVDVASMMHSLEVRTPLIDKEVWEFAASIPEEININNGGGQNWSGKLLLKEILRKQFGDSFIDRKKMGFGVPLSKWFAPSGELHTLLNDRLLSTDSKILHCFNKSVIEELIKKNVSGHLWLLLFLEEWLQNMNENPGSSNAF